MANQSIEMKHLNGSGTYDTLYPKTLSTNTIISDTTATEIGLSSGATVDQALSELKSDIVSATGGDTPVGNIMISSRTDLDNSWRLCNGAVINEDLPVRHWLPQQTAKTSTSGHGIGSDMFVVNNYCFLSGYNWYTDDKYHWMIIYNAITNSSINNTGLPSMERTYARGVIYYNNLYWAFFDSYIAYIDLTASSPVWKYFSVSYSPQYVFTAGGQPYMLCSNGLYKLILSTSGVSRTQIHSFTKVDGIKGFCNNKLIFLQDYEEEYDEDYEEYFFVGTLYSLDFNGTTFNSPVSYTLDDTKNYGDQQLWTGSSSTIEYIAGNYYIFTKSNSYYQQGYCVGSNLEYPEVTYLKITVNGVEQEGVYYVVNTSDEVFAFYRVKSSNYYLKIASSSQLNTPPERITDWKNFTSDNYDVYSYNNEDGIALGYGVFKNDYIATCFVHTKYSDSGPSYSQDAMIFRRFKALPSISLTSNAYTYIKAKE